MKTFNIWLIIWILALMLIIPFAICEFIFKSIHHTMKINHKCIFCQKITSHKIEVTAEIGNASYFIIFCEDCKRTNFEVYRILNLEYSIKEIPNLQLKKTSF